jgi:alpha-L-fucosidase
VLYAFALGWPSDNRVLIKSLASTAPYYERQIRNIELLGAKGEVSWTRESDGLSIRVPQDPPCHHAYCFRILPE